MAPENNLPLEIGHVLFIDIVGYSKLLIEDQKERLRELTDVVLATEQVKTSSNEQLVSLPTGDGMALVFRNTAEEPARCALQIAQALKSYPELPVRMGIHSGPVSEVKDLNEHTNIAGAGINMAQRVMDCGDAGHILLSQHVADDLMQYRQWAPRLRDLGEFEVKHGVRLHLVNLCTEELGNSELPTRWKATATPVEKKSTPWLKPGLGLCAALLIGLALFFLARGRETPAAVQIPEKSIAVLPFDNLSDDKGNAYFVDGIQDEILTRLAKVADLKVISRTSTLRFKSKPGDLSEIARQLGVSHILEGSAQRSADQVRVNVQLIKAANDTHLWGETFDRKLTDVFAVETEIATKIAGTLQAKLTGAEHIAIAARPTENSEAHDLYLRGRFIAGKRSDKALHAAIDYYNQALAKDPDYALAYAGLADTFVLLTEYSASSPAEFFPKARAAAEKAMALDPLSPEAHVSRGTILQADELNLREAKREFDRAIELNPNSASAHYFLGLSVYTPLGRFDEAIAEIKSALALDPFSAIVAANLGYCYIQARRYPEAVAQLNKALQIDPDFAYTHGYLGLALGLSGDFPGAVAELDKSVSISAQFQPMVFLAYFNALQGDRAKALQLWEQAKEMEQREGLTWAYGNALVCAALGDTEQAIDWLERSYQAKETGVIGYIKVDPLLDPLRGSPRFQKLANEVVPPGTK